MGFKFRSTRGAAGHHSFMVLSRVVAVGILAMSSSLFARSPGDSSKDDLWRKSLNLALEGDFKGADKAIHQLDDGKLIDEVRGWLDDYQTQQAARRELDRADFEKYVGYAKARIERKEFAKALDQAILAHDVADDKDAMLAGDWMRELVNKSLEEATELRKKRDWRGAWHLYADLSALYERETRYQKLEHEVLTHLRLDHMFKEDRQWAERLEKVQWKDAEAALECIGLYYVVPPDFKAITERGLEQLLLLAESESAQQTFEGLKNEDDRGDFVSRIQENLDQVRAAANVDRTECVQRFRRAVLQINKQTVRLPDELVVSEIMRGALEPLDDFTTMIWPQDTDEFDKHTRGDFIGVGISIIKNKLGEIEVVTPLEDTPAFRHGVQPGDIIAKVDGEEIKDWSLNKVVDTITGPKGTPVTLTIRRDGKDIEFPLVREKVKIQSVKGWDRDADGGWNFWKDYDNRIAYVRIANFQRNTAEDLMNAMSELQAKGVKGLVLDLRGNPGGLLDSAWQVTSLFLNNGDAVVSTKGRNRSEDQVLNAPGQGPYTDIPMVVLVDEASASASEIVSGALRDDGRATVIGERTFGKFSVQNLIPLSSSNAKLKITTARYYIPSGVSLHREPTSEQWGVEPQIHVPLVRWERVNVYQLRRDADLLGAAKPDKDDAVAEEDVEIDPVTGDTVIESRKPAGSVEAGKNDSESEKTADADKNKSGENKSDGATADADKKDELPPLEQPDVNNRPKVDPQMDTALLVMRIKLLAQRTPSLAAAERDVPKNSAQP